MLGRTFRSGAGRRNKFDSAPFVPKLEAFSTWMEAFLLGGASGFRYINHGTHIDIDSHTRRKAFRGVVYSF